MQITLLTLVFLFVRDIRTNHSTVQREGGYDLTRWLNSSLSPKSPIRSSPSPFGAMKAKSGALDQDIICHSQCLALKAEVSPIYFAYPNHEVMKYLYSNCGMVTQGKYITATSSPTCWCHTSNASNVQPTKRTLSNCRYGIRLMRNFAKAMAHAAGEIPVKRTKLRTDNQVVSEEAEVDAVHMQQGHPSRPSSEPVHKRRRHRVNTSLIASCCGLGGSSDSSDDTAAVTSATPPTPAIPPSSSHSSRQLPEEADFNTRLDDEPEGSILCTDVRVSGEVVRAMLDTGTGMTIIHQKFASNVIPLKEKGVTADSQKFSIVGTTHINMEIRRQITIRIKVCVTDLKFSLILGNDFFVAYAAKIQIFERKMELFTGQGVVRMTIKFRPSSTTLIMGSHTSYMMDSNYTTYMGLLIPVKLNGIDTRMLIDTASSVTVVSKNMVSPETFRPTTVTCAFGAGEVVGFLGETDVNLLIKTINLNVRAHVPDFIPRLFYFMAGTDFIKQYVQKFDFAQKSVTLRVPWPTGYRWIVAPAVIVAGE